MIVADLAQLLGWLSFDSSRYGAAERYLLLSLGICRALGARDRAANVIGMLSYVSASAGHGPDAVRLAEAAARECERADPILRARLLGREATAAAADGDLARFRRQSEAAAALLERHATRDAPSFLYYLTPEQLTAEAGLALVLLAERTTASRGRLLAKQSEALSGAVTALAAPDPASGAPAYPRSALLHATYLARACLLHGDLDQAVAAMRTGWACWPRCSRPAAGATCDRCGRPWPGGRGRLSCASSSTSSMRHHRQCDHRPPATRPSSPPAQTGSRSPNACPPTRTPSRLLREFHREQVDRYGFADPVELGSGEFAPPGTGCSPLCTAALSRLVAEATGGSTAPRTRSRSRRSTSIPASRAATGPGAPCCPGSNTTPSQAGARGRSWKPACVTPRP